MDSNSLSISGRGLRIRYDVIAARATRDCVGAVSVVSRTESDNEGRKLVESKNATALPQPTSSRAGRSTGLGWSLSNRTELAT